MTEGEKQKEPKIIVSKGKSLTSFEERTVPTIEEDWQGGLRDKVTKFLEENLKNQGGEDIYEKIKEKIDRDPEAGLFDSIQEELIDLEHSPNEDWENTLKMGRQYLINEARERMIFRDIKPQILKAQISNDYDTSLDIISNINTGNLEYREAAQSDWSKDFRGMLNEYKITALFHTRLAYLRASGEGDSAQAKGLERKLEMRSWGDPPLELYPIALQWVTQQEVEAGPQPAGDQVELAGAINQLTESLTQDPQAERLGWIDMEYKMEFWERFDPRSEPRFYKNLTDVEQRALWQDRWQLARAAYFKKETGSLPENYKENKDLQKMGKEKMERLYDMPGVKRMMEGYAQAIVLGEIKSPDGQRHRVDFWGIKDAKGFDELRKELREKMLIEEDLDEIGKIEADAVAWNMIWVGNLVESVDSRYSYTGKSHSIPGILRSEEYKYALHPQERFESKSLSGHFYGAFGKWGVEQMGKFKDKTNFRPGTDQVMFMHTEPKKYWTYEHLRGVQPESEEARKKGGKVYVMYTPECYPTITAKSYWEETRVNGKPLLSSLLEGEEIDWEKTNQDAWPMYMFGKFNKAVQLFEYYRPGRDQQLQAGGEEAWAKPLIELFEGRLKPKDEMERLWKIYKLSRKRNLSRGERQYLEREDPTGKLRQNALPPTQSYHNLKVWAVYAGLGGVSNPKKRKVTSPLIGPTDRRALQTRLSSKEIGFIKGGILGQDVGDRLIIK